MDRFPKRNGSYFRNVQRYEHHSGCHSISNIQNRHTAETTVANAHKNIDMGSCVYMYSFALQPEEHQPSGSCNFSRIDKAELRVTLNALANPTNTSAYKEGSGTVVNNQRISSVYAVSYNVLRIMSGMGGLAYAT